MIVVILNIMAESKQGGQGIRFTRTVIILKRIVMRFRKVIGLFYAAIVLLPACNKESTTADASAGTGKGGSLARFTISGNFLYLADYSMLRVFDISNPVNTAEKNSVPLSFGVETIFPYKDKLFIGATQGMYVFSIADPAKPVSLGSIMHLRSCDPVVANDTISYTTLQGTPRCGPAESGLYIYDIKTVTTPVLKKLLPLSTPYGLGLVDSVLFVCRGDNGLSAINVKDAADPKIMYTKKDGFYLDVIPYDSLLICYISAGILVYDASNTKNILKLGTVNY
jgi:hypothetical protein